MVQKKKEDFTTKIRSREEKISVIGSRSSVYFKTDLLTEKIFPPVCVSYSEALKKEKKRLQR